MAVPTEPVAGGGTVCRPQKGSTACSPWYLHPARMSPTTIANMIRAIRRSPFRHRNWEETCPNSPGRALVGFKIADQSVEKQGLTGGA